MDYLEGISDPLKYYFKEKIGSLYINKDVMKLLIEKGSRGVGQTLKESLLPNSDFETTVNRRSREPSPKSTKRLNFKKTKEPARNTIDKYDATRAINDIREVNKKLVNPHLDSAYTKIDSRLNQFEHNNGIVKGKLAVQTSSINSRLFARKHKHNTKGKFTRAIEDILAEAFDLPQQLH